ncbi:MAG: tetratricopeptide repeat protein [Planctomycetes bacterium]|nr:tetratricopeptide repeat protein [Planctomycetota bacterium]
MLAAAFGGSEVGFASEDVNPLEAGAQALRDRDWSQAEVQLQRALAVWPGNPDVQVLLAISMYHAGRTPDSAALMRQAIDQGTRYEARALYYLGMMQLEQGDPLAAQRTFARLIDRHPDSSEAAKMREAGTLTLQREEPRGANAGLGEFSGLVLVGYDDHPDDLADQANGSTADADAYLLGYFSVGMRFKPIHVRASYTHLDYLTVDRLDADSARFVVDHAFIVGDADSWVPRYSLRILLLEQAYFETRHDLSLRWNRRWNEDYETDVTPYVAYKSHPQRYGGEDGWVEGIDARATKYVGGDVLRSVFAAVGGDAFQADAAWLGWNEAAVACGAHVQLGWGIEGDATLRYRKRVYAAASPIYGVRRDDDAFGFEASVSRPLTKWLLVQAGGEHDINRSNIPDYRFDRDIATLGLLIIY